MEMMLEVMIWVLDMEVDKVADTVVKVKEVILVTEVKIVKEVKIV